MVLNKAVQNYFFKEEMYKRKVSKTICMHGYFYSNFVLLAIIVVIVAVGLEKCKRKCNKKQKSEV